MQELIRKARAKVNLGLDVIGERPDGYHELRMIMQTIDLSDEVTLRRVETPGIRLTSNMTDLPTDRRNLAYRAAALLLERPEIMVEGGLEIHLEKHIPAAAGLAGGSTDAAAVLTGVNELFALGLSRQELMDCGVRIGADVPYCICGGTALAEGIGERLSTLTPPPPCHVLLAKPPVGISTAQVYGALDAAKDLQHPDIDGQIRALEQGDLEKLCALMGNVLETVTIPLCPAVEQIRESMQSSGAVGAMMSGSGPTVFGIFADENKAQKAAEELRRMPEAGQVILTSFFNF